MKRHFFNYLAITAIVVSAFTSCKKDDKPKLILGSEIVEFSSIPTDAETVNIQSNTEWSVAIEQTDDWLSVTPMSGNGDGTLVITAQDNDDFEEQRSATITITGEGVQEKTIAVTQKFAVILLETYSHQKHNANSTYAVYEYDAQHRITKRSVYYYPEILYYTETITYNADGILFESTSGITTTTFTQNTNKISINDGGNTSVEMELNAQGLPEKLTIVRSISIYTSWYEGTYTFTWENGNLTQQDRKYYRAEDGKEYDDIETATYTYDNKKSPFYYCTTPKWFLMYWRGIDYCNENNLETEQYSWNPTHTYTCENTYNADGFLAIRTGDRTVISEAYDYMKR